MECQIYYTNILIVNKTYLTNLNLQQKACLSIYKITEKEQSNNIYIVYR